MKAKIFGFLTIICAFLNACNTQAETYPKFVKHYTDPDSNLYRLEATTVTNQHAELRFSAGGKLVLVRTDLKLVFTSIGVNSTIIGRNVNVLCSSVKTPDQSLKIGQFKLGQDAHFVCPESRPYSFFWVD